MVYRSLNRDKKEGLPRFEIFSIVLFLAYYLLPSVNSRIGLIPGLLAVFLYVFYASNHLNKKLSVYVANIVICAIIIAAWYYLLTETVTISKDVDFYLIKVYTSKLSQVLFAFFPLVILFRVQNQATQKQKKIICGVLLALIAYVIVLTWRELIVNPDATREWGNFAEMSESNVGTYAFVYAISVLIPALLIMLVSVKKFFIKFSIVVSMAILFAFLLIAQYTLSIIIALIGTIVFFFITSKNQYHKAIAVVGLLAVYVGLPYLLYLFASKVGSEQIAIRFREIADALTGNGVGYNLGGRLTLYGESIIAFLKSPVFGNRTLGFDPHATLLSIPARIGILGTIPYYYLYFSAPKRVSELIDDDKQYKMFVPVFVCFICMGLTNPIHSALPIYMVVWLLTPLLINLFGPKKE